MLNDSLLTADRSTHLKVVSLSIACALLVVTVGATARSDRQTPEARPSVVVNAR